MSMEIHTGEAYYRYGRSLLLQEYPNTFSRVIRYHKRVSMCVYAIWITSDKEEEGLDKWEKYFGFVRLWSLTLNTERKRIHIFQKLIVTKAFFWRKTFSLAAQKIIPIDT